MIPRDKKQLFEWLENNLPSVVLRKAVRHGKCELLGAFRPVPNSSNPGWVIRVTSPMTNREWYVVVALHADTGKLNSYMVEERFVDMDNYVGGNAPLYKGDCGGKLRGQ